MEASYPPSTVAEDTASTPLQKVGRYHAVILTGQEASIMPRAVRAGFIKLSPMPPKSCLTSTMAMKLPTTGIHQGALPGRLSATRRPVTAAEKSPVRTLWRVSFW